MSNKFRSFLSLALLLVVLAVGITYIVRHKSLVHQLGQTPFLISFLVFGLYILMLAVLVGIFEASLRLCRLKISWRENGLLNAHSLFINFFVPGQGGPVYRGLYVNRRHKLRARHYIIATLLYYAIYAVVNVILLLTSRPWWQTMLAALLAVAISYGVIRFYTGRTKSSVDVLNLSPANLGWLTLATVAQAVLQIIIYAVELHGANQHIRLSQVVVYTGAANLALFVSLTPGAIGIRETFLIFTRHLHHISNANIIVANVIDRSVYLVFLLVLLVLTAAYHIRKKEDPFRLA